MIVVNGRCSGAAPEMQLELRYQLMRAFGRVLGLAWSQNNDNVYTERRSPLRTRRRTGRDASHGNYLRNL